MSRKKAALASEITCPCGGAVYASCCGPLHDGAAAPDALALMRSRYSAYALRLAPYLLATWHSSTRPHSMDLADDVATHWLGLTIMNSKVISESSASVEFVARYKTGGRAHRMHEISRFVREDTRWYYVEAVDDTPTTENARNKSSQV